MRAVGSFRPGTWEKSSSGVSPPSKAISTFAREESGCFEGEWITLQDMGKLDEKDTSTSWTGRRI